MKLIFNIFINYTLYILMQNTSALIQSTDTTTTTTIILTTANPPDLFMSWLISDFSGIELLLQEKKHGIKVILLALYLYCSCAQRNITSFKNGLIVNMLALSIGNVLYPAKAG